MQHVARIRSADERLTSHAPVYRSSSILFRCAVLRPRESPSCQKIAVVTHTTSSRRLAIHATTPAAPAATLAWSLRRLLTYATRTRIVARRCTTISESDTRTTREWNAIGRGRTGRSRARTGARAWNTADEKRSLLPFFPPFTRPFFSETVNRALLHFTAQNRTSEGKTMGEKARKANEFELFHTSYIWDKEDICVLYLDETKKRGASKV